MQKRLAFVFQKFALTNLFLFVTLLVVGVFSFGSTAHASLGGLDYARIVAPNQIKITYEHTLTNNVQTSYSNLGMGLLGRQIDGVVDTGDNYIILSFDGGPLPPNTTGTIDIDTTVEWDGGNFGGTTNFPVDDGQNPYLGNIVLNDVDSSSGISPGDTLAFHFIEPMNKNTITSLNLDSALGLSNGHTFGTSTATWNKYGTILTVTLGNDENIEEGDTVSPAASVTDLAGNEIFVPEPFAIPVTASTSRNLYFNGSADSNWDNILNWWNDASFTEQATALPTAYDNVFIYAPVTRLAPITYVKSLTINPDNVGGQDAIYFAVNIDSLNGVTFNSGTFNVGYILGDVTFNAESANGYPGGPFFAFSSSFIVGDVTFSAPTTANYGTIYGDTTFHGQYGNAGLIFGNVEFNDFTSNPGTIVGHVTFRDHSFNAGFGSGTIQGDVDVYYPVENPIYSELVTGSITYHGYEYSGGTGTVEDPYLISTCEELQNMKNNLSSHFKLSSDIDCAATSSWNENPDEWVDGVVGGTLIPDSYASVTHTDIIVNNNGYFGFEPIGNDSTPFTGSLDGDNHTISNLWIFRKGTAYNGIFGQTSNATISNLSLSDSNIVGSTYTGGVVGYMNGGTVTNVSLSNNMVRVYLNYYGGGFAGYVNSNATISYVGNSGGVVHGSGSIVGGLIGKLEHATLSYSSSSAAVDGGWEIGGIVGELANSSIDHTFSTGAITSNRSEYVIMKTGYQAGGFVGYMSNSTITDSYASGDVNSSGYYAGGFAGMSYASTISTTYATGNVTGNDETVNESLFVPDDIGGFVGQSSDTDYDRVFATGNVSGHGSYMGGFAGMIYSANITNAYARGNVSGNDNLGGFAGYMSSDNNASKVYSTGSVQSTNQEATLVGGLVGGTDGELSLPASFWDSETSLISSGSYGTPKLSTEMKTSSTFTDAEWDFYSVWRREDGSNDGYPTLRFYNVDTQAPVLTEVTPIASNTTIANAVYHFRVSESCDPLAESPTSSLNDQIEVHISDALDPNADQTAYIEGIRIGGTYSFNFSCQDAALNQSNVLHVGPFTVIDPNANNNQRRGAPYMLFSNPSNSFVPSLGQISSQASSSSSGSSNNQGASSNNSTGSSSSSSISEIQKVKKDLKIGMKNKDVKILQLFLIKENKGQASVALKAYGSNGYFGKLTKQALIEWQKANNVNPATGSFGKKTRAKIKALNL